MNPYQVLNIPEDASEDQIKAAYRELAKKYHPDVNKSESAIVIIQRVNEAYEILSDPARKAQYKYGSQTQQQTEAGRQREQQVYTYRQRRAADVKREQAEALKSDQRHYRVVRMITTPILLFALVLVLDEWLPPTYFHEPVNSGYTVHEGRAKGGAGYLLYFLRTDHFVIGVPGDIYGAYNVNQEKGPIEIEASPVFKIAKTVTMKTADSMFEFESEGTIYEIAIPFHILLLLSSLFTVLAVSYSPIRKSLCYLPMLLLGIILYIMISG